MSEFHRSMTLHKHAHVGFAGVAYITIFTFFYASSACAQQQSKDVPPGSFIYSREVPTRQAQDKGVPGQPHYVVMGGKAEVNDALHLALTPLTDKEQGEISAAIERSSQLGPIDLGVLIGGTDQALGRSASAASGPSAGSTISGALSSGLTALGSAMGSFKNALSRDQ